VSALAKGGPFFEKVIEVVGSSKESFAKAAENDLSRQESYTPFRLKPRIFPAVVSATVAVSEAMTVPRP